MSPLGGSGVVRPPSLAQEMLASFLMIKDDPADSTTSADAPLVVVLNFFES